MITDTPISVFRSAQSTQAVATRLGVFLSSEKHKERVLAIRAETEKKLRDERKKTLPAATISGTFQHRSVAGIQQYNGLVCIDFDAHDNPHNTPAGMKAILSDMKEVAYAGLSVSGTGVFAIIPTNLTDPERHAAVVDLLGTALAECDLYYDRACKDVCRLRFVSYDPDAYWNPAPRIFDASTLIQALDAKAAEEAASRPRPLHLPHPNRAGSSIEKKVEQYIESIEATHSDITTQYDVWMRLGMALATEFGSRGEQYFQRISQFHPKYNPSEIEKKYLNFIQSARSVRIGTFFKLCNDHGIRI